MNLLAISINHKTAPVELREALHLSEEEIKKFTQKLKDGKLQEGLIISTCNRTEIYGVPSSSKINHYSLQDFITECKPIGQVNSENFNHFSSFEAIKHLFYVISGIDSMLIGDNQIYHQVKDSFKLADELEFTGFLMRRIFSAAVKAGKRALTETEISEGAVTVSYAAVQLIEKIFSNLSKKSALIIGAGETGEIAAKHLAEKNIGKLTVTNRTIERAEKLSEKINAKILPFNSFKDHLQEFDIIISATSADNIIITSDDIKKAMKKRSNADMVIMDIAVPRDIDSACKNIDYVFYHDIDSLNIIVEQNLAKRKEEIPKVQKIIDEELDAFIKWYNSLEVAPTIKTLRDYFELIRFEEVEKNKNRFSEDDREKLDIITKRIINKILHVPTVELKKMTANGNNIDETAMKISIIRELFGIDNNEEGEKKN